MLGLNTANFSRGPGLWRFNNSYLEEPEFKEIVNNAIKVQTRINADDNLTDAQWDELLIEDYQNIKLADDVDARIFLNCLLASIRGECIKYGAANKRILKEDHEFLKNKIAATNWLKNLKENPPIELLEKLDTYMELKCELDEKNNRDAVCKHRAKLLL